MKLYAVITEEEDGWLVGQIQELPAVASQGRTLEELHANLQEALELWLASRKDLRKESLPDAMEIPICEITPTALYETYRPAKAS